MRDIVQYEMEEGKLGIVSQKGTSCKVKDGANVRSIARAIFGRARVLDQILARLGEMLDFWLWI